MSQVFMFDQDLYSPLYITTYTFKDIKVKEKICILKICIISSKCFADKFLK